MSKYDLLNKISIGYKTNENSDNLYTMYDINKRNNIVSNEIDDIIEHPYIKLLDSTIEPTCNKLNILLYRLNTYNEQNFLEFYLINGKFISLTYDSDKHIEDIHNALLNINGVKKMKGYTKHNNENISVVQCRNNNTYSNWVTIWDILINNHYFGEKISEYVIDFFLVNSNIANLYRNEIILYKPLISYCNIDNKYHNYIKKTNSIQYCQNKQHSIIQLHDYEENDNVRNICFVEDCDKLDYNSNENYLLERKEGNNILIFKTDNDIISYIK